jgi:hypothetical protein
LKSAGEVGQIGFCCFGPDAQLRGGDYHEPALDVGLGLRPDLVGKGLEVAFPASASLTLSLSLYLSHILWHTCPGKIEAKT